jgi:hypothetical protein
MPGSFLTTSNRPGIHHSTTHGNMEQFNLNGQAIRFFETQQDIYFVTGDANTAFGFKGENTLLDILSVRFDSLVVTDRNPISHRNPMGASKGSTGKLLNRTMVILLPELIKAIIRSKKPELANLADVFAQLSAKGFMATRVQSVQKILPPATDHERTEKLATATHRRILALPKTKVDTTRWNTLRELLTEIANEYPRRSLLKDRKLSYWLSHHLPDVYRAQSGEDPPLVRKKGSHGYCYPAAFRSLARTYVSSWEATKKP